MSSWTCVVPGTPKPKGNYSAYNGRVVHKGAGGYGEWVAAVRLAASRRVVREPFDGPVSVELVFHMPRPKKHYRTGKHSGALRDDAPEQHTQTPDVDKLSRAVLDALTEAGVWLDDGQVVMLDARKVWAPPGCQQAVITVREIT